MTSRERVNASFNHQQPDQMPVDFGAASTTGVHVLAVQNMRKIFGLEDRPIKIVEPYQMLGEVDEELRNLIGIDVIGVNPKNNMFGFANDNYSKEFKTFWGQTVLVPEDFNTRIDEKGDLLIYPEGDMNAPASGKMPQKSYFFDTIIRQEPVDDSNLNVEDNLEEFGAITEDALKYIVNEVNKAYETDKAILVNYGGTALGDIALVPGPFLKHPKGIRDISEWYMSTLIRRDYIAEIFDRQSNIAIENLKKLFDAVGNKISAIYMCGTDFGTQDSTFCAPDDFDSLWKPYYKRMNDWIHQNTEWKAFKHSCGAIEPLIQNLIEAGFDILNPVQINARNMIPENLKKQYGHQVTFWGGGVDTQVVLASGTPQEVMKQVLYLCEVFNKNGGFIYNTIHNTQANVPIENLEAMIKAIHKFNGK